MSMFADIKLGWQGKTYAIPARQAMQAIAIVEEVITLQELMEYARRGTAPVARLANAYARILDYAGCKVDPAEVYAGMFQGGESDAVLNSINTLLMMMIPPSVRASLANGKEPPKPVLAKGEKEADPGNRKAPGKGAFSGGSKSQRALGGSRRPNSGR